MAKFLASLLGILLITGVAVAEPPLGKGGNKESTPGPVQVLANQQSIGAFLQDFAGTGTLNFSVLSRTGYRFHVLANALPNSQSQPGDLATSPAINVYYETPDCTSPAYVIVISGVVDNTHFSAAQGFVFPVAQANPIEHFYVPVGSVPEIRQFQAEGPFCSAYYLANHESVEALPNDPTVTGVPNESFTPPITLGN